jgi:hypothetical protein
MWEQYKKTFLGVQILAFGAAAWVYLGLSHWWGPAAIVFCTMQISAVFGAMWANRIKRRIEQSV